MEEDEDDIPFLSNASKVRKRFPFGDMESVVASVSGYHGLEKFKLIKLITQTGASYVGTVSKSTTHLVCWNFEGRKYRMAKDIGIEVVNHRWFEECMKERKRLPEAPYIMHSGKQVGPLLWKPTTLPDAPIKKGRLLIRKEKKVLIDPSNTFEDTDTLENIRCLDVGCSTWTDPDLTRQSNQSGSYSSLISAKPKKKVHPTRSSTLRNPVLRGRRLVKKSRPNDLLDSSLLDFEQESVGADFSNRLHNTSGNLNCSTNEHEILPDFAKVGNSFHDYQEKRSIGMEEVEEAREDPSSLPNNLENCDDDSLPSPKTTSCNEVCHSEEKGDGKNKGGGEFVEQMGLPMATELSCVICWTEYSSIRGILPCHHRFCYSCIQSWADQMVSRGKVSTCPLCKAPFVSITKVEGASCSDQKIYSQSLPPITSSTDVVMLAGGEGCNSEDFQLPVCYECRSQEPADLLLSCNICRSQWVHSYCLDPPLFPWTCIHCRDQRLLYQRFRY